MTIWSHTAIIEGRAVRSVRIETDQQGRISAVVAGQPARPGDDVLGLVAPGFANAHSHLFHRALRGRTHDGGGDFWRWREQMYCVAGRLDPGTYGELARGVFTEMLRSGYTSVGEFHYVHHHPDGTPYSDPEHAMELAVVDAAADVGIRLTLLDTVYLTGNLASRTAGAGAAAELGPLQRRFSDGTAQAWLDRWHRLADAIARRRQSRITLGAAIHSVRAVPEAAIATIAAQLPAGVPLHVHLSEQPQENADCLAATGLTPTGLLARAGALSDRLTAVHATHLSEADVDLLGSAGVGVVMCPSTEADLGDGIGPARRLGDAGATISIGSDQNAVVDPLLELRGLEAGERLASGRRGRFSPAELWSIGTANGRRSLGTGAGGIRVGEHCDLVELDAASVRTLGSHPEQVVLTATASDVTAVVVAGRRVAADGVALLRHGLGRVLA